MGKPLSQEEAVGGREAPCHNFAFPGHSDIERQESNADLPLGTLQLPSAAGKDARPPVNTEGGFHPL